MSAAGCFASAVCTVRCGDYTLADEVLYRGLAALNSKVVFFSPAFGFSCLLQSPVLVTVMLPADRTGGPWAVWLQR